MSKERRIILWSILLGGLLIELGNYLMDVKSGYLQALGLISIILTYAIFPMAIGLATGRELVDKDNKVFNGDGVDVTKRLPTFFAGAMVLIFIVSAFLHNYLQDYISQLAKNHKKYDAYFIMLRDFSIFFGPYVVLHAYFFFKDLPVLTMFRYAISSDGPSYKMDGQHKTQNNSSTSSWHTNPGLSNNPGNIYYRSDRR